MPNIAWVKNVYSLFKQHSKNSDPLSPLYQYPVPNPHTPVHNNVIIPHLPKSYTTYQSTAKSPVLPPLKPTYAHFPQDLIIEPQKINLKSINNTVMGN